MILSRKSSISICTWLLSSGFIFYEILLKIMPSIITTDLQHYFSINAEQLAILSSSYIFGYGIGQIPAGMVISRWGIKKTFATAFLITTLTVIAFNYSHNYILACGLRFVMGLSSAYAFVGCLQLIYNYFPPKVHALLIGLSVAIAASAGMVSTDALTWIVKFYGWKFMIDLVIGFGLINTLLLGLFLTISPSVKTISHSSLFDSLKIVIFNKTTWVIGIICSLVYLPYAMFNDLWGQALFAVLNHLTLIQSGWLISAIWFGWMIGSPIVGALVSAGHTIKRILLWASGLELSMVIFLIIPFNVNLLILISACFLLGVGASSMNLCYLWVQQHNPPYAIANAVATVNTIVSGFVLITLPIIGFILDRLNMHLSHSSETLLTFTATSYTLAFSGLCISMLVAILLIYRVKD